jgi:HPt (histidine-containing phosphotransfer) domain-containing protein
LECLKGIDEIDEDEGLKNGGSGEGYMSVLSVFRQTAGPKADEIEALWKDGDTENYTIKVHALKSSARLIGAQELSDEAKVLEEKGDARDEDYIEFKTPDLLDHYRRYVKLLAPFMEEEDDQNLPQIADEQLVEALKLLARYNDEFDFDGADSIIDTMKTFSMPKEIASVWKAICKAESAFMHDELAELLNTALQMMEAKQ